MLTPVLWREVIDRRYNESRAFHGVEINGFNADDHNDPYSFIRCDFRQSTMVDSRFAYVDFSNSDFVGATIRGSTFENCNMMSTAFSACALEECMFSKNRNFNSDIIESTFENSHFRGQLIDRAVWRDLNIEKCTFKDVTLSRSTIDGVAFSRSSLDGISFVANYCSDCTFVNCQLSNVEFDATYFGTNIFRGTDLSGVKLKYKDNFTSIDPRDLADLERLRSTYENGEGFSEAFSVYRHVQIMKEDVDYPVDYLHSCLSRSAVILPQQLSVKQLRRLMKIVTLDFSLGLINNLDLLKIDLLIEKIVGLLAAEEQLRAFLSSSSTLTYAIGLLKRAEIDVASDKIARMSLTFTTDDEQSSRIAAEELMGAVAGVGLFEIVSIRKGSVIIDIVTYTACAVLVASAVRIIAGHAISIYVDFLSAQASRRVFETVSSTKALKEVNQIQIMRRQIHPGSLLPAIKDLGSLSQIKIEL
ncbi:pentapeptide repeat-containing protein [Rhizobium leguminosarum]|nr:pentapeptide repeat-containing protein [Rhizobium leguminosarum]TBF87912.1 pentapeptide repeat-containing protein [Rhizobium leguminosarum]TBG07107.1 pentapeptide repeat-containing protein [Rhizobium leguminosarum]TBG07581.1 pentapeptide repeat-containing protein [Rhizobium leguminosarum]TBG07671.1 pentapeptide repeat-containing protein [Rhizobium leguminosarum]TBG30791.1 pentapeptide repeat-containing protein [Rhizobium leguminosarum]